MAVSCNKGQHQGNNYCNGLILDQFQLQADGIMMSGLVFITLWSKIYSVLSHFELNSNFFKIVC